MAGLTNTMLQGAITDEYRGRIMSIFSFMFIGLMPAGQPSVRSTSRAQRWTISGTVSDGRSVRRRDAFDE